MKPMETTSNANSTAWQFDRLPPHDVAAEMCVLGAMVLDAKTILGVRSVISRDQFFQADHQVIYDAIIRIFDAGIGVDAMTLRNELDRAQVMEEIGGLGYLGEVISGVPSAAHAVHYAEIIREKWAGRQLIQIGNEVLRQVYGAAAGERWHDIAAQAMTRLAKLHQLKAGESTRRIDDILLEVYDKLGEGGVEKVPSGFYGLDDTIGGFGIGEMWLVGARPSMGKSTLSKQIALRAAKAGVPSAVLSLEEGAAKIGRNILASEARIENSRIRSPKTLTSQDWVELDGAVSRLGGTPLYVNDKARRLQDLHSEASLMVARYGVKLIVIDYLQRIQVPGRDKYERAGNASEGVSDMIKDLGVAGVIPVQLNRGVEGRDDKRPNMSDLRDSGQIEQDADGIMFLHREDYYHTDDGQYEPDQKAELIIAKNRDGVRGQTVNLRSNLRFQTFEDWITDPF